MMDRCLSFPSVSIEQTSEAFVGRSVENLARLAHSTESEFLALGQRLQEIAGHSRETSSKAAQIAAQLGGAELASAIESLQTIQTNIDHQSSGAGSNSERLLSILKPFGEIPKRLDSLGGTVRILEMVGFLVKVENARFEKAGTEFNTVAANLQSIGKEIRSKAEDLSSRSSLISASFEQNVRLIWRNESQLREGTQKLLARVVSSLTLLRNKHHASANTLKALASRFQTVSENIADIIVSLQFHDITRQRIEHSLEALKTLTSASASKRQKECEDTGAGTLCSLQADQLRHAMQDLNGAVQRIRRSLKALIAGEHAISREALQLTGLKAIGEKSFLSSVEDELKSLSLSFEEYERIRGETTRAIEYVLSIVRDMSEFATDINRMGTQIRFVAMNASINAARVGEMGASLGVLAIHTQELSQQTALDIDVIAQALESVFAIANEFSSKADTLGAVQNESAGGLRSELELIRMGLNAMNAQIEGSLQEIDGNCRSLSENIAEANESFRSPDLLIAELNRLSDALEFYAAHAGLNDKGGQSPSMMEHLQSNYTMQAERDIHRAHRQQDQAGRLPRVVKSETVRSASDELGDNVELF